MFNLNCTKGGDRDKLMGFPPKDKDHVMIGAPQ